MKTESRPLPKPTVSMQQHSDCLQALIHEHIADAGGAIPFADYMQLALYAPGLGYYSGGLQKFGKLGDFITAPESTPLFAQCLANQCADIMPYLPQTDILEFGAGSGRLAYDLLHHLQTIDNLPEHYYIIELSADLRARQQETLANCDFSDKIIWLDHMPKQLRGIVIANEVIDAMPVHRIHFKNEQLQEYYVCEKDNQLAWQLGDVSEPQLDESWKNIQNDFPDLDNYITEINCLTKPWLASITNCLEEGVVLLIDYGYPQSEFYHPQYHQGHLRCFYRHHVHDDPLINPGLQDITTHVNFTALAEAASSLKLDVIGFTTQANFLINCGLIDLVQTASSPEALFSQQQAIKQLTLPSEMGETFKVIALCQHYEKELRGFSQQNQLYRL